ncbi:SAF domain-containing protein [Pelagibacteraceae bacterium]|nr:SAF domain-containing protein [Pelagibacteraceae bacterium]
MFVVKDIKKGEVFTKDNIRRIRPGNGISPIYYEKLLNKKSNCSLKAGSPLKMNFVASILNKKVSK